MGSKVSHRLTVTLAGNPNVGKSTLFNSLTGMHQHTGNWPGKTVGTAQGKLRKGDTEYLITDLPGTYSLEGISQDERIAGEYISKAEADCTVVVCDATCLERSLILALQILEKCQKTVICVNLIDEARRRGITVDGQKLSDLLEAPVVLTAAGTGEGMETLVTQIHQTAFNMPALRQKSWSFPESAAEEITRTCVIRDSEDSDAFRRKVDRLLVSRRFGVPLMFLMLFGIIWLTVWGANYPSMLLQKLFDSGYRLFNSAMAVFPWWLRGFLLDGVYSTSARVIAVMLPPMAIFFPLFTFLEDVGYLPRMAFLLDPCMARCGGCGKQALTMCMGLGCNAVGVMGCRIIDSPRERLCAIVTNAMVPCNGRFPALILLGSLFFHGMGSGIVVAACVALGAVGAMGVSGLLSKTVLRSEPSVFLMEMPPFRRPRLGQIITRSLIDRTAFVGLRALKVAAPAGGILWILSCTPVLSWLTGFLEPVGRVMGMNGVILLAFVLSFPANELLIPMMLLLLTGGIGLQSVDGAQTTLLYDIMTWKTALCTMVFTLFHWPCSTTVMTIYRETDSKIKTAAAVCLPTAVGILTCMMLNLL
ncbi:MAG: ferrous iron transporter B [Oscillospiraceae bacterium]|nr:ferrous iron transporter B [Oscillospiraceae bacterium]